MTWTVGSASHNIASLKNLQASNEIFVGEESILAPAQAARTMLERDRLRPFLLVHDRVLPDFQVWVLEQKGYCTVYLTIFERKLKIKV